MQALFDFSIYRGSKLAGKLTSIFSDGGNQVNHREQLC